ncbi:MAG: hypothetical protein EOO48_07945 [Flavobacterium sp.]|nr:MAG: hypothetical protein EOO48_07945 [Flavobacterium sp.]
MFKKFLWLEWKAFTRSASFRANVAIKILMGFMAVYFTVVFLALGIGAFYIIKEEMKVDPLVAVNRFMIYYVVFDLIIRLLLQKIPVMNIRPLLVMNIRKNTIVNFAIGKMMASFFNFLQWFFFIPFSIVLMIEGYDPLSVILWYIGMMALIYANNFLNILLNDKDYLFIIFGGLVVGFAMLQYYGMFDITLYTAVYFEALFHTKWMFVLPVLLLIGLYTITFHYFRDGLHLDTGLKTKQDVAKTEQFEWLDQFGTMGTFLKNDIRLIKRNKRSKTTVVMSFLFLFYGLLFFSNGIPAYNNPYMHMFAGVFVTGGFLFTFGQFVPSWDSAYYNLMMTQNISYKGYLMAKWWLVVIATAVSAVLASFYLYFGWHTYLMILVGAVYNIGFNSHLVLLGGAYTKTPVDLASSKAAFGDKKAFNVKTMLISLPKLLLPMLLYGIGTACFNPEAGLAMVAIAGIAGFAFRDKMFSMIERIYKTEKYSTIQAYKQNNN